VIVTRQRRKPFPWRRFILPLIAVALVIFAFVWPPSNQVIVKGPLAPLWSFIGDNLSKPFDIATKLREEKALRTTIAQQGGQISTLQADVTAKAKQIADLTSQVDQLKAQAAAANSAGGPAPAASAAPAGQQQQQQQQQAQAGAASVAADMQPMSSQEAMRRTAQYWSNMEPDNAAKVVQKLPIPYVASVMTLMSPDDVGAILDALPASYAAELTQEHPELKR
jgi:flagellar motility protein MotE (MotC chaperone)